MTTTRDKIIEKVSLNGVTSENKTIHSPPPPLHSKLACLLFSSGSLGSSTTLHGDDGGGKALFPPFKLAKLQRGPLGRIVLAYFVAN